MKKSSLLLAFLFVASMASAAILRVNNNSGYTAIPGILFVTLDAAWTAAVAGDVIIVEPSPNNYFVGSAGSVWTVNKQVTVIGNGAFHAQHPGLQVNSSFSIIYNTVTFATGSQNSVFKGVWLGTHTGNPDNSINVNTNDITIERCGTAYLNINAAHTSNTIIKSNWIYYGVDSNGWSNTNLLFANNVLYAGGFLMSAGDVGVIENCTVGLVGDGQMDLGDSNSSGGNFAVSNCLVRGSVYFTGNAVFNNNIFNITNITNNSNIYLNNATNFNAMFTAYNNNNDTGPILNPAASFSYTLDGVTLTGNPAINTGLVGYSTATHTSSIGDDRGVYNNGTDRPTWKPGLIPDYPAIYVLNGGGIVTGNNVTFTISTRSNN